MKIEEMIEILTKKIKESKEHDAGWRAAFRDTHFSEFQIHVGEELLFHLQNIQDNESVFPALYSAIAQLRTLYLAVTDNYNRASNDLDAGKGTKFYSRLFDLVKKAETEGVMFPGNNLVRVKIAVSPNELPAAISLKYIISQLGSGEGHSGYGIVRDLRRTLWGCRRFTNQEEFKENAVKAVRIALDLLKDEKVLAESRQGGFDSESYSLDMIRALDIKIQSVVMPSPAAVISLSAEELSRQDLLLPTVTNLVKMIKFLENMTNAARYVRLVEGAHGIMRLDDFSGKMIIPGEEAINRKLIIKLDQFRNAKNEELAGEGIRVALLEAHQDLSALARKAISSPESAKQYYMVDKLYTITNYFVKRQLETLHAIYVTSSPMLLPDIIKKIQDKISESRSRDKGFGGLFRDTGFSKKQIEIGSKLLEGLQSCGDNNRDMTQLFKQALAELEALTSQPNSANFSTASRGGEKIVGTRWYLFLMDLLRQIQREAVVVPEETRKIEYIENPLDAIPIQDNSPEDAIGNERAYNSYGNNSL